jgi:hypothetical protein
MTPTNMLKNFQKSGVGVIGTTVLLWLFLLKSGQCLSDGVCALDGQRSLAGAPRLDSARRDIEGHTDSGSGAAKLADDNLHNGPLSLGRASVDAPGQPHDPTAIRHQANDAAGLAGERNRSRRERGRTLNPTVKTGDRLESHGIERLGLSVGTEHGVDVAIAEASELGGVRVKGGIVRSNLSLGGFDGLVDLSEVLGGDANAAELGDASSVAGHWLDSHRSEMALAVDGAFDDDLLFARSVAAALAVKAEVSGDFDADLSSGGGSPSGCFHNDAKIRRNFVACKNYLRKSFVSPISARKGLHNK